MTTKPRILIVDDNLDLAEDLGEILGEHGYAVELAGDGPTALSLLGQHSFALMITDLRMPGLDGVQILDRVQVHWPTIPVILITAYPQDELLERTHDGPSRSRLQEHLEHTPLLKKPFAPQRLLSLVQSLL